MTDASLQPLKKTCSICKLEKTLDRFSPQANGKLMRHSQCKPCRSSQQKAKSALWNEAHYDRVMENQKRWQKANIEKVREYQRRRRARVKAEREALKLHECLFYPCLACGALRPAETG